jgi:hypothetical protein
MRGIFNYGKLRPWMKLMCLAHCELHLNLCREQHSHEAAVIYSVVPHVARALSLADLSGHSLCTVAVEVGSGFV